TIEADVAADIGRGRGPDVFVRARAQTGRALTFLLHDPVLGLAVLAVALLVFLAVFGRFAWPKDPLKIDVGASLQPPSRAHPMGTDGVGRDVFARFNNGAGISLAVGAVVVIVGAI